MLRTRWLPAFPVPDHRSVFQAGEYNAEANWGLPVTILSNKDVFYLSLFHSRLHGEVYAVRARKLRSPSHRRGVPLYADDVDIRLFTICNYNFWNGRAWSCAIDDDVLVDAEGTYTLVASDPANRPDNASGANAVTWFDTGPFRDGQLTYRMLLADGEWLQEMRRVVEDGVVSDRIAPYLPDVAQCSRQVFESGGFGACKAAWMAQLADRQADPS